MVDANALHDQLVEAYRRELMVRYSEEALSKRADYRALPSDRIQALREFFLEFIYPPKEDRRRRDLAFEDMGEVLKSPRKMLPLTTTAISSIWKLGRSFPAAVRAGFNTLRLYLESDRLEKLLIRLAQERNYAPEDFEVRKKLAILVADLPEDEVILFRNELILLFESLANTRLLKSSLGILEHSREIMESKPDLYSEREMEGLDLGYRMLSDGYELFNGLKQTEVGGIISAIKDIEIEWFEEITALAHAAQSD